MFSEKKNEKAIKGIKRFSKDPRGAFKNQSNMQDRAFLRKQSTNFAKKIHLRRLTKLCTRLCCSKLIYYIKIKTRIPWSAEDLRINATLSSINLTSHDLWLGCSPVLLINLRYNFYQFQTRHQKMWFCWYPIWSW